MAYLTRCTKCNKDTMHSLVTGCIECALAEIKKSKEIFLKERNLLPIEDRLVMLEGDIFDLRETIKHLPRDVRYG